MICNECETVAHCLKNGCVPKQQPAPSDETQRLSALVRAQQITIDKLEAAPYVAPQLVQEPVECMCGICKLGQRPWVGLTDDERLEVAEIDGADEWFWKVCKAIEAKLKEKNT